MLWIGIAACGVMTLIHLLLGVQRGSETLLVSAILDAVLSAGLVFGYNWAWGAGPRDDALDLPKGPSYAPVSA